MRTLIEEVAEEHDYEYDDIQEFEEDGDQLFRVIRYIGEGEQEEKYGFEVTDFDSTEEVKRNEIKRMFERVEEIINE